jgi:hypothetical protein
MSTVAMRFLESVAFSQSALGSLQQLIQPAMSYPSDQESMSTPPYPLVTLLELRFLTSPRHRSRFLNLRLGHL